MWSIGAELGGWWVWVRYYIFGKLNLIRRNRIRKTNECSFVPTGKAPNSIQLRRATGFCVYERQDNARGVCCRLNNCTHTHKYIYPFFSIEHSAIISMDIYSISRQTCGLYSWHTISLNPFSRPSLHIWKTCAKRLQTFHSRAFNIYKPKSMCIWAFQTTLWIVCQFRMYYILFDSVWLGHIALCRTLFPMWKMIVCSRK